jgi:transposase
MPKSHRPYPPEFRQRIIELVRRGRTPEELARQFEPSAQTVRNWVRQADRDDGRRQDGLMTVEQVELRCLRLENRALRAEREILRKPRPGLRGRPPRSRPRIRVRDRTSGRPSRGSLVPNTGCLPQRVSRVAQAPARAARPRRCGADVADRGRASRLARDVWRAADPCRACRAGDRWPRPTRSW